MSTFRSLFLLVTLPLLSLVASAYENQVGFILSSRGESQNSMDGSYNPADPIDLFLERHVNRFEFGIKPGMMNLIRIQTQSKSMKSLNPSVYFGYSVWQGRHWGFTPQIELGYRYYRETSYYSYKTEEILVAPGGKFHFQAGHFKMAGGNALNFLIPTRSNDNDNYRSRTSAIMEFFFQIGFLFDLPQESE